MDAEGTNRRITLGEGRGPASLVDVDVDDPGGADAVLRLKLADCDYRIVDNAEPMTELPMAVMGSAAEVETKPMVESAPAALVGTGRADEAAIEHLR